MHKQLFVAVAAILAAPLAMPTPVAAQQAPAAAKPRAANPMVGMTRADANMDGKISRTEADGQASQRFDRLDANRDGFLAPDEMPGPAARMMGRADADHDGKLSRAEYLVQAGNRFDRIDADRDGQISAAEMKGWADAARARQAAGRTDPADAIAPPQPAQQ
jgi:starvation-inducible outer membrane lipoprotein